MQIFDRSLYLPFASPLPAQVLCESVRNSVRAYLGQYGTSSTVRSVARLAFKVPLGYARVHGRIDLMLRANGPARRAHRLQDF